jgi:N-acetylmuramoyl-L-alanine amidase
MRIAWTSALGKGVARRLMAAAIGTFACSFACVHAAPANGSAGLTVLGVRFGGDNGQTRIVIESDRSLSSHLAIAQDDPRHIVVSLSEVAPPKREANSSTAGAGFGFVRAWRIEAGTHGSRLLIDLNSDCEVTHRFALGPVGSATSYRYVVDIAPAAAAAPAVAAMDTKPAAPVRPGRGDAPRLASLSHTAASRTPPLARRVRKVIVVDAGHGGHDPGAQAADLNEKDITLATALALRKRLEHSGRYKVVMTRDSDVFIPLPMRVQIARHAGADLFISLHADSAGGDPDTHGASVYTLSDLGETRVTEVLGQGEWFTRPGDRPSDPTVGRILLDLTQRSTLNRSALFAGLLIDRVSDKIDLLPRTHRDAGYFVLLAPDVPAVLLEMGFISSPRDQARLTDIAERTKLTDAIADAIDAYFDNQPDTAPASRKAKAVVQAHTAKQPPQLPVTQSG